MADRVGATPAQVLLRWHLDRGLIAFPKTTSADRLAENLGVAGVRLAPRDLRAIDRMRRRP